MPYLRTITQDRDVRDGNIEELVKVLDNVVGLKNKAIVPTPSPSRLKPHKLHEGLREKKVPFQKVQPTIETAQPPVGALD